MVGRDLKTDVALLKIEAKGMVSLPIGDTKTLKKGQWVMAIGSPFGLESTVTLEGPLQAAPADRTTLTADLMQRAPGYYAARIPLDRVGTFSVRASARRMRQPPENSRTARSRSAGAKPRPSSSSCARVAPR